MYDKRGLSTVVTTLIIILLVLVAVGIVWVVIRNVITEGAEEISLGRFVIDLKIKDAVVNSSINGISMKIKRNVGKGDLAGIKFICNAGGNSEIWEESDVVLEELGEIGFGHTLQNLNISDVETVSIAPIFRTSSGERVTGRVVHTYRIRRISIQTCGELGGICCTSVQTVCLGGTFWSASDCSNDCCVGGTCCEPESTATTCGTWECGQRTNNCGDPVTCGTCGINEHCESGSCVIDPFPCDLTSATWSQTSVVEGTLVNLNVQGTNCAGKTISFEVREDEPIGSNPVGTNPVDVTFGTAGQWTAEWIDDGVGQGDPEYYFIASVDGGAEQITSSNQLSVAQAAQPCALSSALWSQTSVVEGTLVNLNVQGTNCDGETISFEVREDEPIGSSPVGTNPANVVFSGSSATGIWTAEWIDDGIGQGDPEYYFIATVVSDPGEQLTSSNQLSVTQVVVPQTCSELGGTECTGEQYCSGNLLNATDTTRCCDATCEDPICTTCDTCGDGWFNTCDRAECYSCTSDSCYFIDGIINECFSCTAAACENYANDQTTCTDDPCSLGSCLWDGNACVTISLPNEYLLRSFSSQTVSPGGSIDVSLLMVNQGDRLIFLAEETTPSGWTITADPHLGGPTNDPNILRWYAAQSWCCIMSTFTFQYTIEAPLTSGSYDFEGIYNFDIVVADPPVCGNGVCEVSPDNSMKEPDADNAYYCPQDCSGIPTLGPTTVIVA